MKIPVCYSENIDEQDRSLLSRIEPRLIEKIVGFVNKVAPCKWDRDLKVESARCYTLYVVLQCGVLHKIAELSSKDFEGLSDEGIWDEIESQSLKNQIE